MSGKANPDQYLYKRSNSLTWCVRIKVPSELTEVLGAHLQQSLGTRDKAEANRRKHVVISKLFDRIETTRLTITGDDALLDDRAKSLMAFRKLVLGFNDSQEDEDPRRLAVSDELERMKATTEEATYVYDAEGVEFLPAFEEWSEQQPDDKDTQSRIRKVKRELTEYMGGTFFVQAVKPKVAKGYLGSLDASKSTKKARQGILRRFWAHLIDEEVVAANPWQGLRVESDKGKENNVRPFEDYELLKLLKAVKGQPTYWHDLCIMALVTGARIEEIARLQSSDVFEYNDGYVVQIAKGKTDGETKRLPVLHSAACKVLAKRSVDEGFLFPECESQAGDLRRSKYFSKRFSEWKSKNLKFGKDLNFHSFRRYLSRYFRQTVKDAPTIVAKAFLGHSIKDEDMTFGRYAGAVSVSELEVIAKRMSFPEPIEKALADLASD